MKERNIMSPDGTVLIGKVITFSDGHKEYEYKKGKRIITIPLDDFLDDLRK